MKTFKTLCGNEKYLKLVQMNGVDGLAKDVKPRGILKAIVEGADDVTGRKTYYLCMKVEDGLKIYATQVDREVYNLRDFWLDVVSDTHTEPEEPLYIRCTEDVSRKSGQKYFKILIEDF